MGNVAATRFTKRLKLRTIARGVINMGFDRYPLHDRGAVILGGPERQVPPP